MMDYESLVVQLRSAASEGGANAPLLAEAADAIQELLLEVEAADGARYEAGYG